MDDYEDDRERRHRHRHRHGGGSRSLSRGYYEEEITEKRRY